ncbi:MAG: hypothetical protein PHQ67_05810 [Fermentimonas sp.]|nr:hypothetical protein [Fermentimonas sp.]
MPKDTLEEWVDPKTDIKTVNELMKPYSTGLMSAHTITTDAGNSRINRNVSGIKNRVSSFL